MIMELRVAADIFRARRVSFFATVLVCAVLGGAWQYGQKPFVKSDLMLNVTRVGSEPSSEYQYHGLYRLQADERFGDTVVRWLQSPRIIADISAQSESGSGTSVRAMDAQRLSSQMIRVTYAAADKSEAERIAKALVERINEESGSLNADHQESSWFAVAGDEPVVTDGRSSLVFAGGVSLAAGIFLGFWTVLFRHYFSVDVGPTGLKKKG